MDEYYGSGPALDENFDFSIGSTGDLKIASGLDELQKDLAFQMVLGLNQYIGQPPSGNLTAKVGGTAARIARLDNRVDSVLSEYTEVSFSSDRQEITLKIVVQTQDGEQNLIFDI